MKCKIVNILKEFLSIVYIIIEVIFIFATLGLGFIFLDSTNIKEFKDDETLTREWIIEKKKKDNRIENESIKVSIWTPKIEVKNLKEEKRK